MAFFIKIYGQNQTDSNENLHSQNSSFDSNVSDTPNMNTNKSTDTDTNPTNSINTMTPEMLQNFAKMFMNSSNSTNTENSRAIWAFY